MAHLVPASRAERGVDEQPERTLSEGEVVIEERRKPESA